MRRHFPTSLARLALIYHAGCGGTGALYAQAQPIGHLPETRNLFVVEVVSASEMWLAETVPDGRLWRTTDGANHWQELAVPELPNKQRFTLGITAILARRGEVIVESLDQFLQSTDGGRKWVGIDPPVPKGAGRVQGAAMGRDGTLWMYGEVFRKRRNGEEVPNYAMVEVNGELWTTEPAIFRSENADRSRWARVHLPPDVRAYTIRSLSFRNGYGIAVLDSQVAYTGDGGKTWQLSTFQEFGVPENVDVISGAATASGANWVSLSDGSLLHSGATWPQWVRVGSRRIRNGLPSPLGQILFQSPKLGLAVEGDEVVQTEDAGATWSAVPGIAGKNPHIRTSDGPWTWIVTTAGIYRIPSP